MSDIFVPMVKTNAFITQLYCNLYQNTLINEDVVANYLADVAPYYTDDLSQYIGTVGLWMYYFTQYYKNGMNETISEKIQWYCSTLLRHNKMVDCNSIYVLYKTLVTNTTALHTPIARYQRMAFLFDLLNNYQPSNVIVKGIVLHIIDSTIEQYPEELADYNIMLQQYLNSFVPQYNTIYKKLYDAGERCFRPLDFRGYYVKN